MSTATVVAKGKLARFQDVNYLRMISFEILPTTKPAGDAKPKAQAPGKDKAMTSTVTALVFAGRKDGPRFQALLKEFAGPADAAAGGAKLKR